MTTYWKAGTPVFTSALTLSALIKPYRMGSEVHNHVRACLLPVEAEKFYVRVGSDKAQLFRINHVLFHPSGRCWNLEKGRPHPRPIQLEHIVKPQLIHFDYDVLVATQDQRPKTVAEVVECFLRVGLQVWTADVQAALTRLQKLGLLNYITLPKGGGR